MGLRGCPARTNTAVFRWQWAQARASSSLAFGTFNSTHECGLSFQTAHILF
jgi:hypothetical protein